MNEKLNIQNLIDMLAEKHGMSKKSADSFVKEFFQLIEESLEKDKYVKIRGLGTFKLIDVGSRESVNVNTGERFEIQEHTKVSFTPEPSLKEVVNKPFSHFETVALNEATVLEDTPLESDREDEEEVVIPPLSPAKIAEKAEVVAEETAVTTEEQLETVVETDFSTEKQLKAAAEIGLSAEKQLETAAETNFPAEKQLETAAETVAAVQERVETVTAAAEPLETPWKTGATEDVATEKEREEEKAGSSTMKYFIGIVIFVVLLCGGAIAFVYYPDLPDKLMKKSLVEADDTGSDADKPDDKNKDFLADKGDLALAASASQAVPMPEAASAAQAISAQQATSASQSASVPKAALARQAAPMPQATPALKAAPKENRQQSQAKENVQQSQALVSGTEQKKVDEASRTDSVGYTIVGTETTHTIQKGETLTKVALRFYGTKALWPYIVKHNPNVIKNPDNVPYGTTIKIPKLVKKQ